MKIPPRHIAWGLLLLLFLAALGLAFQPGWHGQWIHDDWPQIAQNRFLDNWSHWREIAGQTVWMATASPVPSNYYRPLQMLTYLAITQLAGREPLFFHLFNWLIHLLNCLLLYLLVRRLLERRGAALAAALIFGLHPLTAETVLWMSGLADLYALAAGLLMFYFWVSFSGPLWLRVWLCSLLFGLALLTKEVALILAVPLLLLPPRRDQSRETAPPFFGREKWCLLLGLSLALLLYFSWRRRVGGAPLPFFSSWAEAVSYAKDFWLALVIFGKTYFTLFPMKYGHPFTAAGIFAWQFFALAIFFLGSGAAALFLAWRRGFTLPLFSLALTLAPLAPVLFICGSMGKSYHGLLFERYFYIATLGLTLTLVFLWHGATALFRPGRVSLTRAWPVILSLLLIVELFFTRAYAAKWRDEETLFSHALRYPPLAAAAAVYLGNAYERHGHTGRAAQSYRLALTLQPDLVDAINNLGVLALRRQEPQQALPWLQRAVLLEPQQANYRFNLGTAYFLLGKYDLAGQSLRACLALEPGYPRAAELLEENRRRAKKPAPSFRR